MITLAEFSRRIVDPAVKKLSEKFEQENPELMRRLRRNAKRRALYATSKDLNI